MTTPFGGQLPPTYIDLLQTVTGNTLPSSAGISLNHNTGLTDNNGLMCVVDWSEIKSTKVRFSAIWGHAVLSTAGGSAYIMLYDYTAAATLATFSTSGSSATDVASTALASSITFTKPSGVAKLCIVDRNGYSNARLFNFIAVCILLF